ALVAEFVAILYPLPDVAVHVVEAEGVGPEGAGLDRLVSVYALGTAALCVISVEVRLLGRDRGAGGERRRGRRSRRVFPLSLSQQTISLAGLAQEPRRDPEQACKLKRQNNDISGMRLRRAGRYCRYPRFPDQAIASAEPLRSGRRGRRDTGVRNIRARRALSRR